MKLISIALCWSISLTMAIAAPFTPEDGGMVLEKLPRQTGNSIFRELSAELKLAPNNSAVAAKIAQYHIKRARNESDPRYYGYAQSALNPWWYMKQPPAEVLILRATLLQNRHEFGAALADLSLLLKSQPRNGQAWLTRSVIYTVLGQHDAALKSCAPLAQLNDVVRAAACAANALSKSGRAMQAQNLLLSALEANPGIATEDKLWALTILAETANRLGDIANAEMYFKQALALGRADTYLLAAYADYLLDQKRAEEVRTLLSDETRTDTLLIRLALAESVLESPALIDHVAEISARIEAAQLRGDQGHLADGSRFALYLLEKPDTALELALQNWQVQREPSDVRRVLEAALFAAKPGTALPVVTWFEQSGLEDQILTELAQRIRRMGA